MLDDQDQISILRNPWTIDLISESNYPQRAPLEIEIYGITDPGPWAQLADLQPALPPARELPDITGNTSSEAAFRVIEGWIQTCDRDHMCRGDDEGFLPNRVLDVGGCGVGFYIHLSDVIEHSIDGGNYVCLSHCWGPAGGEGLLKTTRRNIRQLSATIDWNALPRTYQDAILVTRRLGIRFLWIDSLCIIQDDDEDWRMESSLMGDIYHHAYVTLAASKCTGPHDGLFTTAPQEYKLLTLHSMNVLGMDGEARTRRKIAHLESHNAFPLMRRGWVFQERILSRRVIHFAAHELIWECMNGETCECSFVSGSFDPGYGFASKSFYESNNTTLGHLRAAWCKIVVEYTTLQLTFEKDIFPALSGIANRHLAARQKIEPTEQYIAGMWLTSFPWDLMWHTPPYRTRLPGEGSMYELSTRPQTYRAPSWSWAAIKTGVIYDTQHTFDFTFDVPDIQLKAMAGGTGEIEQGAKLILSGEIGSVEVQKQERLHGAIGVETRLYYLDQDLEFIVYPDYDFWTHSNHEILEGHTLKCFKMGTAYKLKENTGTWFMILNQSGQTKDTYVRVGLAYLPTKDGEIKNEIQAAFLNSIEKVVDLIIL
ncbi:hypothetical protein Forpe1208_v014520 [Fusarium oxysporum f. sp. rapae]|uniref:Heterokaryon incompatibility domain-containing protein n=1 Tax=Fusarium oxysporum f. sp. rapae TaxID=485398 RepID=A0A8J5TP58_FUSOX|nr:hypothetical protein Forpe1208_v014520 [Fusarium oxysporum f. sp. rapae]